MRWIIVTTLVCLSCDRDTPPPATPDAPAAPPSVAANAPKAPDPAPDDDWSFLGPRDDAHAQALRDEHATLAKYLQAESSDGELKVDPADVDALLALAGPLLQEHVGKATKGTLEADGQRFVRAAWLAEHGRAAAAGAASLVRIPLELCIGWGCEIPSEYVAVDCFGPAVVFVQPVDPSGVLAQCQRCLEIDDDDPRMTCIEQQCQLVVDGHFTGRTKATVSESECGEAWEFAVRGVAPADGTAFDLLVAAGEAPP